MAFDDIPIGKCSVCGTENVRSMPYDAGFAMLTRDGIKSYPNWRCIHITDEKPRDPLAEIDALRDEIAALRLLVPASPL